jgi:uncharacterized protein YlxW (UPF0749 family)
MSKKQNKSIAILTIISLVIGIGLAFSVTAHTNLLKQSTDSRYTELIDHIHSLEESTASMESEIAQIRQRIAEIQDEQADDEEYIAVLRDTINQFNMIAGFTACEGPGIVITLDDNTAGAAAARKNSPTGTINEESFIIHDKDILYIIKSLAQNTEALAINGIRIVDISHIRCVGPVIMVNSSRLAPPYEIQIIGNQSGLAQDLAKSSRYRELLMREMPIKTILSDKISLPAYTGTYSSTHASEVKK